MVPARTFLVQIRATTRRLKPPRRTFARSVPVMFASHTLSLPDHKPLAVEDVNHFRLLNSRPGAVLSSLQGSSSGLLMRRAYNHQRTDPSDLEAFNPDTTQEISRIVSIDWQSDPTVVTPAWSADPYQYLMRSFSTWALNKIQHFDETSSWMLDVSYTRWTIS
ncbi:uncharacterized protein VP01_10228g1 [Puccinia sorghi]|uniref:Uncharacterized protein n=1 Tax=Puccinia sorghi TaxID=27349 RepID=A0A0L6VUV6_9BASI|nr:uncharacterized protein VP01_10228g1 [Puccinia sorghi]